ncbi:thiosulfate dehydrogenase [quinone] large subunit [Chitinophaga dinghuensis]|uniref:Thiosulfate dehydrogenase [quinone] large subunit n=1 Tax=Chitinophaga dinghuensis TaxID=1539050 RepID=A0A327VXN7_9BACT|nr:DoxX family membrane protein [Chitinophaga dinghuensis]RAJ76522.1 thiosulfate dehydrogenase [quinone] large subunit [Chitinophaga dinghuensis]
MNTTVYLLLRFAIAASMLGHGLVRLPKLNGFSAWMVQSFEKSMLPHALVLPFSYVLPIAEFIIGLLLLVGLGTRIALIAGGIVMATLIFGSALIESWDYITGQLVHAAFFAILLQYINSNSYSLDKVFNK